jgi:hypothetical protein
VIAQLRWFEVLKGIYYALFRLQLRVRWRCSIWSSRITPHNRCLPHYSGIEGESLSASEFYRIGSGCVSLVAEHLKRAGLSLGANERILDFGCGCGRTLIPLSAQYPTVSWHAVDVDREAVLWCKGHLPDVRIERIECIQQEPHLSLATDSSMRFIAFPFLLTLMRGANAAEVGLDASGKRELESTGFLHRTSTKLKGVVPERYHTTWHTEANITGKLSGLIGPTEYVVVADGLQDIVIARKARTHDDARDFRLRTDYCPVPFSGSV